MLFIVYQSSLKPSSKKGELHDVVYRYISHQSHIGFHYSFTRNKDEAYVFDESEREQVEFISEALKMNIEQVNSV